MNVAASALLAFALVGCSSDPTVGFRHAPEVYREEVWFDVIFCMRVEASPAEVERFITERFPAEYRVAVSPDDSPLTCPARFWPRSFSNNTVAYRAKRDGDWVTSTQGAIVEDGYLYYWNIVI